MFIHTCYTGHDTHIHIFSIKIYSFNATYRNIKWDDKLAVYFQIQSNGFICFITCMCVCTDISVHLCVYYNLCRSLMLFGEKSYSHFGLCWPWRVSGYCLMSQMLKSVFICFFSFFVRLYRKYLKNCWLLFIL